MIQTFTPDDVLKAQSGELSPDEVEHLTSSIKESSDLQEFAETAEILAREVPKMITEPTERPLNNIMAFIKSQGKP